MRGDRRRYRGFLHTVACLTTFLIPMGSMAEKGALTLEAGGGCRIFTLHPPYAGEDGEPMMSSSSLLAGVAVRFALTHDLSVGIEAGVLPWRTLVHEDVLLSDEHGSLAGRLVHTHGGAWAKVLGRVYLAGYDWRAFLEPAAGWGVRRHRDLDHQKVSEGDVAQSYGLDLPAFTAHHLLLGAALGLEHVWDRTAVGIRAGGSLVIGEQIAPMGRLILYSSYDFYP